MPVCTENLIRIEENRRTLAAMVALALLSLNLGRVDGDEAQSKRDERAVVLRRLLASKCDTLPRSG